MPTEYDIFVRCVECGKQAHADHVTRLGRGSAHQWPFQRLNEPDADYATRMGAWRDLHPRTAALGYPYHDDKHAYLRASKP
jgi:hypothetical protein